MNIVSDTNIFLAVALGEPEKDKIIEHTSGMSVIAPEILPYEIGNALSAMTKRKRITNEQAILAYKAANKVPVRLVGVDVQKSLRLAMKFNIYAYDAYFLQSARSMACPLMTLDKRMKKIATELDIEILE